MAVSEVFYGVPGAGKSTLAAALADHLAVRHLELDDLRPQRHAGGPPLDYTTDAWRRFGALTPETAVAGLLAVRSAFSVAVERALVRDREAGFVAESAFVDPAAVVALGIRTRLITLPDPQAHYERFFVNRERSSAADDQFTAARHLQDHLIREATELGIDVIENDASQRECLARAAHHRPV